MRAKADETVSVLKLTLHGRLVGYIAGMQHGKNSLYFADSFKSDPKRPTFSLITHPNFPRADKLMSKPWTSNHRLHPIISNLLPEGMLRELIAQTLKVHVDSEFQLLTYLGNDLPGALVAEPMSPEEVPDNMVPLLDNAKLVKYNRIEQTHKFSLAGVQMKFSMKEKDGRYNLSNNVLGDWIIKTPSTMHKNVPANEYTAMTLASLAGVDIPPIQLVALNQLDHLPQINLPDEKFVFAIKRFDRDGDQRIHMEDFAQILVKYPHEKYNAVNYEQIGRILFEYSGDGILDTQQFARRLLVNILLANGDAHIKNWSLLYTDQITPRLSPAYDIVTTRAYMDGESDYALNLGKNKNWYAASFTHFETWSNHAKIPWRIIKPHLDDTIERAKTLWPQALSTLPMDEVHQQQLREHWRLLHSDFKIL